MCALRLDLLGVRELQGEGVRAPLSTQRHVQALVYVVAQKQWVARERLALLFWPDHPHAAAMRNVRKIIHLIGAMPIPFEARQDAVRCLMATDVDVFEAALAAGQRDVAIDAYGGEFAPGLEADAEAPFSEWLRAERIRLAAQWRAAVLAGAGESVQSDRALAWLERLVAADPLDEDALALTLSALRKDGRAAEAQRLYRTFADRVARELGIEPSARLRELASEVPATTSSAVRTGEAADIFVGRRVELRLVEELLSGAATRAIVLHGPGGVGKSRLAREVLARAAPRFADGVHWVALEDVASEAQLPARISQAVGLEYRDSADAVAALGKVLASRQILLVLDNAEHLPDVGAQVARLLQCCERLRVIVTSRARPAGLEAELLSLAGLELPDDESLDPEAAGAFDAVRLFIERAHFHQPSLALVQHLNAVIQIVHSVQGLPLAIELAAAWVRLLPPAEIARELQDSIDVLERDPAAGAPARTEHASVRATLQGSWLLLAPKEREALAKLAVFRGGFTREAAQAVAGASLPLLAALVDKSLVQADSDSGRFDLHPLVAVYAREQLTADPLVERDVLDQHGAYFAAWMQRSNATARTDAAGFKRQVDPEFENCRQAWRNAVATKAVGRVAALAGGLSNYLENCGRFAEGEELLSIALVLDDGKADGAQALAQTCRGLATLQYRSGRHDRVDQSARRGVRAARLGRDGPVLKACLNVLGLSLWMRDRFGEALLYFEAALKQAERDGDRYGVAVFSGNIGLVARDAGQFEKSLRLLQATHAVHREIGNARGQVISLNNVGNHYRLFAQWDEARRHFLDGLALAEQEGLAGLRVAFIVNLGLVDIESGAHDEAERHLQETLALRDRGAEPYLVNAALLGMARLAVRRGDSPSAHRWLSTALRDARTMGGVFRASGAILVLVELLALDGRHEQAQATLAGLLNDSRMTATVRVEAERLLAVVGAPTDASSALSPGALDRALDRVRERSSPAPDTHAGESDRSVPNSGMG